MKAKYLALALMLLIGLASAATFTITLNESNAGNIGDTYVQSDATTTNYGTSAQMLVNAFNSVQRSYLLFNLSSIPTSVNITNAQLCLYMLTATSSSKTFNAYNTSQLNSSGGMWTETNLVYNTQPTEGTLQQGVSTGTTSGVWLCWNVTNAVAAVIPQANKNMSIEIRDSVEGSGASRGYFCTKENATASCRPYLNVTYTYTTYPETGLVGYWRFDENTGASTLDSSGYNSIGTLANSPTWTTGKNYQTPYALSFNGTNQYVTGTFLSPITSNMNFTVSIWIKPSTLGNYEMFEIKNATSKWTFSTQTARLLFYNGSASQASDNVLVANVWQHVAVVYNGTSVLFYKDGVSVGMASIASVISPLSATFYHASYDSGADYFPGVMDEMKIYNYSLSASQVMAQYANLCPLYPINITTYNESSTSQTIGFNFVALNTTSTFTYNNAENFTDYYCNASFPIGNSTTSISNSSFYSPRYYYSNPTLGGSYNLSAYLLPLSDLYEAAVTIYIKNSLGSAIPGAMVTVQKSGSVWTTVAQDIGDSLGGTFFNLDAQTMYQVIVNAIGYAQTSYTLQPTQSVYTFTLLSTQNYNTSIFNDTSLYGVTWNLTPSYYMIEGMVNFNFSISNANNDFAFWGMNVTYNGTNQFTTNQTDVSGGSVNYTLNTSLVQNGSVNVSIFFMRENMTYYDPTFQYWAYSITAGQFTFAGAIASIGNSALSPFTKGIVAILLTCVVVGYVSTTISFSGGVILALLMMWGFWSFGYMNVLTATMVTLIGIAVIYNRHFALTPIG